jgi:hypothetical protein
MLSVFSSAEGELCRNEDQSTNRQPRASVNGGLQESFRFGLLRLHSIKAQKQHRHHEGIHEVVC